MSSSPPSYRTSKSVSRSSVSRDDMRSLADAMLSNSLSRSTASSTSVSRSKFSQDEMKSSADEILRRSLSRSHEDPQGTPTNMPPRSNASSRTVTAGSDPSTSAAVPPSRPTATSLKRQLRFEVDQANSQQPPRDTKLFFKKACSTDLLFLIDTTFSMEPYLESAVDQVKSIVLEIQRTFFGESEVRVAVVSYKDHKSTTNIAFLDFTTSTERVCRFLDGLETANGVDFPEDVLGGINQALQASWNQQTRCMVHIGDAPPHGRGLHDLHAKSDDYYAPGSEPHGLTYKPHRFFEDRALKLAS